MKRRLSRMIFWLMGWKVIETFNYPNKCVVVAAPHTSNWDFFIGRCYAYIIGINASYLIKSSFFVSFIGFLFKRDGGIPVYRDSRRNIVDQIVERFNNTNNLILAITPEGTRSLVEKWKTGFYHIACKANVPIVLLAMDFEKRRIGVIDSIMPTGNINKDMLFIQDKYKDMKGKIPEYYNPEII